LKPGTRRYANAVIRRIKHYIKKNESYLRKRRLSHDR
jgi:hypothetical protein